MSDIEKARAARDKHLQSLSEVPVQLQVVDSKHAKSPEVLEFCKKFLEKGGRYDELRRVLGLGPSHVDRRWRVLRILLPEILIPVSEEEALKRQSAQRVHLMIELEEQIEKLDEKIKDSAPKEVTLVNKKGEEYKKTIFDKNEHQYWKMKFDALKIKLDENQAELDSYINTKKLKAAERNNQGTSIIVQNNYHIARPGDVPREVAEVEVKRLGRDTGTK